MKAMLLLGFPMLAQKKRIKKVNGKKKRLLGKSVDQL